MFRSAIFENAQKDLAILDAIVRKCSQEDGLNLLDNFYLAGGTALALQLGHRISYDLDFFTPSTFNSVKLLNVIKNYDYCGQHIDKVELSQGTLLFKCNTNVSFFEYRYKLVDQLVEGVLGYNWLNLASVEDIALMKVTAISSRGARKDFVDFYFALKYLGWTRNDLLKKLIIKYPDGNIQHLMLSLKWFDEADKDNTKLTLLKPVSWEKIKHFFEKF